MTPDMIKAVALIVTTNLFCLAVGWFCGQFLERRKIYVWLAGQRGDRSISGLARDIFARDHWRRR